MCHTCNYRPCNWQISRTLRELPPAHKSAAHRDIPRWQSRIHDNQSSELFRHLSRHRQPNQSSPILYNHRNLFKPQCIDEAFECIRVHLKRILIALCKLIRAAKPDEVHRNNAVVPRQYRDHFAIEKRPRWFSMQAQNNFSLPLVYIVDAHSVYLHIMGLKWKIRQVLKALFGRANNRHG